MSSYARYCQSQAAECARRAKLASSPDVAADRRELGLRWLKLAEKAESLNPGFYQNALLRARALDALGRRREAVDWLEKTLAAQPAFLAERREVEKLLQETRGVK